MLSLEQLCMVNQRISKYGTKATREFYRNCPCLKFRVKLDIEKYISRIEGERK